ncbi:cuticular protein, putative, partial [Ixodes scapularis]
YQFGYDAQGPDGSSSRQETSDGSGRVQGSYTITTADGLQRKVKYAADEGGFRARVDTNEPGTTNDSPADVTLQSSAPSPAELSAQYTASRGYGRGGGGYGGGGYGGGGYGGAGAGGGRFGGGYGGGHHGGYGGGGYGGGRGGFGGGLGGGAGGLGGFGGGHGGFGG